MTRTTAAGLGAAVLATVLATVLVTGRRRLLRRVGTRVVRVEH